MKYLILLGLLAAALSLAAGSDYNKAILEIKEAFPGIIGDLPQVIEVVFDNGAYLDLGKNITPTEAKNQPVIVDWNADNVTYYTLMVVDPDPPSRPNPYMRDILTWLVGNIPGNDIAAADVLVEYVGTAPPEGMGMNRYFYFVFRQPEKLEFNEKRIDKNTIDGRVNFSVQNFVEKYNLGHLDGVNFLTSYFDPETVALYKQLRCCEDLY